MDGTATTRVRPPICTEKPETRSNQTRIKNLDLIQFLIHSAIKPFESNQD